MKNNDHLIQIAEQLSSITRTLKKDLPYKLKKQITKILSQEKDINVAIRKIEDMINSGSGNAKNEILNNKTILVVDDVTYILLAVERYFKDTGARVFTYSSSYDALRCSLSHDIDLLVADIFMPQINGCHLAKIIKLYNKSMKVVLMTGHNEIVRDLEKEEAFFDYIFEKPIVKEKFLDQITFLLKTG